MKNLTFHFLFSLFTLHFSLFTFHSAFAQQYGWTAMTSPLAYGVLHRIYVSGDEAWLLGNDKIFYSSNCPAEPFSEQFTGVACNDLAAVKQGGKINLWAVGYISLGARTTDTAGHAWTKMSLGGSSTYTCVSFPTKSIGFASGIDARLSKTVNGGVEWKDAGVELGFGVVSSLFFVDSVTGYVGTEDPRLAKTTDGGSTWVDVGNITNYISDIYFYDSNHGWVVGVSDILCYKNGIWTRQKNPTGKALYSVFFLNENEGWISGDYGVILHSTDGGANWTIQLNSATDCLADIFFTSPTNGYAVGYLNTILHYTLLTGLEEGSLQPADFKLEQNCPNPFKTTTTISWHSAKGSRQTLKIFDVFGNEVATLVDELKPAGKYSVDFNAKGLPAGVYFYQLRANGKIETKKMIVSQ
jgi:photosystem II stability/assembly factor-like uncharacterized protein